MKTYTKEELSEILDLHKKWLADEKSGIRADLSYADLRSAVGETKYIKSLQCEKYYITYTSTILNIGCQSHTIEEWKNFDDETISKMDNGALDWWKKWKPILMNIIEVSPALESEVEK